ncbi:cupin domain-containing protein [Mariniblastus sp.]|nr:cupin domain-containing protein [Mariniblastus sp.]
MKVIRGSGIDFIAASHEDPKNPGVLKRVLATHEDFSEGRIMMLNWARLPLGSSFAAHYHEDMQETFVILTGKVQMVVGEESVELNAGDAIMIDHHEIHQMHNRSDHDVDYIVFGVSTEEGGKTIVV